MVALGEEAIPRLVPLVPNSFWLGRLCGQSARFNDAKKLQLFQRYAATAAEREANFGQGLAYSYVHMLGDEEAGRVARQQRATWQPAQLGIWLVNMPMTAATWQLAQDLGPEVVAEYWQRAWDYVPHDAEAPEAIKHFLAHHRPAAAVQVLTMLQHHDNERLPMPLVLATLEALWSAQLHAGQPLVQSYQLETLLNELPHAPEENRSQAVRLAFLFSSAVPLENPQLLNEELGHNPAFYVDLLEAIYKPDEAVDTIAEELSDDEREIKRLFGTQAWGILHHWESVPGVQSDGTLDGDYLLNWVEQARALAAEKHITKGFDIQLGLLLSHAPPGADGVWPHPAVCQILEAEAANETIARHVHMGRYNIHGRAHAVDGGMREERIADEYAAWARRLQTQYPATARILRALQDDFETQAEGERQRADREDQFGH